MQFVKNRDYSKLYEYLESSDLKIIFKNDPILFDELTKDYPISQTTCELPFNQNDADTITNIFILLLKENVDLTKKDLNYIEFFIHIKFFDLKMYKITEICKSFIENEFVKKSEDYLNTLQRIVLQAVSVANLEIVKYVLEKPEYDMRNPDHADPLDLCIDYTGMNSTDIIEITLIIIKHRTFEFSRDHISYARRNRYTRIGQIIEFYARRMKIFPHFHED